MTPDWEISLNEVDWLTIAESGQFESARAQWLAQRAKDPENPGWREERQKARLRWLKEADIVANAAPHDPFQDERTRQAIDKDHIRTEALLQAAKGKRTSLIAPLLAILLLLVVGIGIWRGQREKAIQTGIASVPDCAADAADGVNWSNCDKRGLQSTGLRARNARMARIRLDGARLAGAELAYAALDGANLRNVEFNGADLVGADLTGADLSGADLTGANLRYAVLTGAVLTGARLDSAALDKAIWIDGHTCAEGSLGQCL